MEQRSRAGAACACRAAGRGLVNLGYIDNVVQGTLLALTVSRLRPTRPTTRATVAAIPFHESLRLLRPDDGDFACPVYRRLGGEVGDLAAGPLWARRLLSRRRPGAGRCTICKTAAVSAITKAQRELGFASAI
ncbi:MAG: hypothetical protein IPO15_17710 [Anaerolineae bacterium]|uniref:hypothetical protein n=1 Tax=Candidatus Amarolinea dominans TaxID=3140696 RepID=UPI0031370365|nr:hypothetical protein [Anaerolineae bacterium]